MTNEHNNAAPTDWRELCRRLYVELWHCDKQMTSTLNEDDEPMWTTGQTVRDVLNDAKSALEATPTAAPAPAEPFGYFRADAMGWTDCAADEEGAIALYERPQSTAQAVPSGDRRLDALAKRTIFDAIRSAYDLGYNDARNARAVPGDNAPGYDGRSVEEDHGGALHSRLKQLAATPTTPATEQSSSDKVREALQRIADKIESALGWVEIAHRPPVRDAFERGRMVNIRLHALADLHDELAAARAALAALATEARDGVEDAKGGQT